MQRNFDNNINNLSDIYNTINNTNLVVATLPTKTDVNTSIVNNNLNYTTSLLTSALINSNIIANNLLYSTTTSINNLIATNNVNNIALIKSYSVKQSFTDIDLTGKLTITTIGDTSTSFGYNSYAGSQSIAIGVHSNNINQLNSVAIGFSSKNLAAGSVSIGSYATSYANSVAIGYNSGNNQTSSQNTNNTFLGNNSNILVNSSFSNSTAIGYNSIINNSNTIQLGRDLLDTTNCYALTTTNLTATNTTVNNITTGNLNVSGTTTFNYTTNPLWGSFKNAGFSTIMNTLKSITSYDIINNFNSITLPCGIYMINYSIQVNYSLATVLYWLTFGISTTLTNFNIQENKNYCSSNTSLPFSISNSFCFTSTGNIVYLNCLLNSYDNTITAANLSGFIFASKISATRLA